MRLFKNPQMKIGEIRIEDIQIDKTSKDDVPRLLVGLQSIYSDKELLKKISDNWLLVFPPLIKIFSTDDTKSYKNKNIDLKN